VLWEMIFCGVLLIRPISCSVRQNRFPEWA